MKVLLVNGSPRENGNPSLALAEVARALEANGIESQVFWLGTKPINDCIACGTCIDECPAGAISEGEKYSINPDACVECGTCADVCPQGAISLPE